jgi:hypothetical protein
VAGRIGFCGLDRRREPLQGDEVRACWVDGAVPAPADPVTPGLLDLLTVALLHQPPVDEPESASGVASGAERSSARPAATAGDRASHRLWVEVEAQPAKV